MWTNSNEELVYEGSIPHMDVTAYIAKWDREGKKSPKVMTQDGGLRQSYYTIRFEMKVAEYTFHNYGVVDGSDVLYFAHRKGAIEEIEALIGTMRAKGSGPNAGWRIERSGQGV